MKTILSLIVLAISSYYTYALVEEGYEKYKLDSVCIKKHISYGIERKNITAKHCPNNSLVTK